MLLPSRLSHVSAKYEVILRLATMFFFRSLIEKKEKKKKKNSNNFKEVSALSHENLKIPILSNELAKA